MSRRTGLVLVLAFVGAVALVLASVGAADHGKGKGKSNRSVHAKLIGYQEVPVVSTTGKGKIRLKIRNSTSIDYELSYSGLSAPAAQSHIHFGQWSVNGGISAWLCTTPAIANAPAGTQQCPAGNTADKVTITGTILPANIVGPAAQGIAPGEFAELVAAIKAGVAYANVHTATFPGGEIRAQLTGKKHDN